MFHDLNVDVPPCSRAEAALVCARLGYDVIAFNVTLSGLRKLGPEHNPPPLPDLAGAALPYDPSVLRVADPRAHTRGNRTIRALNRVTLVIDDNSQLACLGSSVLAKYDLVAVAPATEKLFQQCLQFDVDIVTISLSQRQQFYLKRPQLHVACEKVCHGSIR
jgi:RNase P/RNase MRP subunit p30